MARALLGRNEFLHPGTEEDGADLVVRPDGENSRVFIKYADGTDCEADAAEHLLEVIRKRLG